MPKPTFYNLPADKQQRIVEAAVEEFGSRPYRQATLDRIVEAAGVSKGSMYQYFSGKVDLYGWLMTEYLAEKKLSAIGRATPPAGASLWDTLEAMFLGGVRFAAEHPSLARMGARFHRDHEAEEELAAIAEQGRVRADQYFQELLGAAVARGELRADVDLSVLLGLLTHALGEGMLDVLARRLGVPVRDMLARPELLGTLDDAVLREIVTGVLQLFRDGAAAPDPSSLESAS